MTAFLERNLKRLAEMQKNHTKLCAVFIIVFTIVMGFGINDVTIYSDMRKLMPLDLPIYQINDHVADTFGEKDTVIIAVQIDESVDSDAAVRDIRDPRVIQSLIFLDTSLRGDASVTSITSPASFFRADKQYTPGEITVALHSAPQASAFFSPDYRTTFMAVTSDLGTDEDGVKKFTEFIKEQIEYTPQPPGIKYSITGSPVLQMTLLDLIKKDAILILLVASVIILLLLFVTQRSYSQGLLIFIPLSLGLIWTVGAFGWLGIFISITTIGLGSVILGLGVEYGVFVVSRYREERAKGTNQRDSLKIAVHGIGTAIIGSGLTTMAGFGALTSSTLPGIQNLGLILALGIGFSLLAALLANPVLILLEEDLDYHHTKSKLMKLQAKAALQTARGR